MTIFLNLNGISVLFPKLFNNYFCKYTKPQLTLIILISLVLSFAMKLKIFFHPYLVFVFLTFYLLVKTMTQFYIPQLCYIFFPLKLVLVNYSIKPKVQISQVIKGANLLMLLFYSINFYILFHKLLKKPQVPNSVCFLYQLMSKQLIFPRSFQQIIMEVHTLRINYSCIN